MKIRNWMVVVVVTGGMVCAAGCSHKSHSSQPVVKKDPDADLKAFAKEASAQGKTGAVLGIGGRAKPTTAPVTYDAPDLVIMGPHREAAAPQASTEPSVK